MPIKRKGGKLYHKTGGRWRPVKKHRKKASK